jgi:hypothetical protein
VSLLDESGLPWHIDVGGSHLKIMLGKRLVTILPKSGYQRSKTGRAHQNVLAQIKRAIKEHDCES